MLREWWVVRRNALLSSSRFQRLALDLAPLRPAARHHARRLFDLVAGFTYAQTLYACVELDLFQRLAAEPKGLTDLAAEIDLPEDALDRLIGAADALGLLQRLSGGRVTLGAAGAALRGNPGLAEMIAHHHLLYADLLDPVALLRKPGGGALANFWNYARGDSAEAVAAYSRLMAASTGPVIAELLHAYDFRRHRAVLDIGGGEGRFLQALASKAPMVGRGLFDLPAVVGRAADRLGGGTALHPGDFRHDPLPEGYDCVSLIRVLHDHDDAVVAALLRKIFLALPSGGSLVIAEPMLGARSAETVGATYFAFYLLAMGSGRARSPDELSAMLMRAGFGRVKRRRTRLPLTATILHAQRM